MVSTQSVAAPKSTSGGRGLISLAASLAAATGAVAALLPVSELSGGGGDAGSGTTPPAAVLPAGVYDALVEILGEDRVSVEVSAREARGKDYSFHSGCAHSDALLLLLGGGVLGGGSVAPRRSNDCP